jgi:predicted nucleic acid-binding protein
MAVTAMYLLDTGPLSTLYSFPLNASPYIYIILQYAKLTLTNSVIMEAGRGKIWRIVSPLLKTQEIQSISTPHEPEILDLSYGNDLGLGERSTIKAAIQTGLTAIIDDRDAFVVSNRFGVHPLGFQDWIVVLAREFSLPREIAIEIVQSSANQYPKMFLAHTLRMLST